MDALIAALLAKPQRDLTPIEKCARFQWLAGHEKEAKKVLVQYKRMEDEIGELQSILIGEGHELP